MAVAFRSDAEVINGTAGTAVTVTKPSGIVDTGDNPGRDQLIAFIAAAGAPTITPPADWVLVDTIASGTDVTLWAYRKLASSEGANWTWTLGSSLRNWGWVGAYTGVDPTSPIFNTSEGGSLDTSTTIDNGDFTTPSGNYIHAVAATRTASGSATTWTVVDEDALTTNERADVSTNAGAGTDISGVVVDVTWPQFYAELLSSIATASQTQTAGVTQMVMLQPYFVPYDATVNGTGTILESAFGVDPDSDSSAWTYTNLSALGLVHEPAKLTLRHGRANRSSVADPCELRFTLKNLNGEFTSPTGAYASSMVRNLPFRVRLNGFGVGIGEGGYHRGTFFLASARPRWDASENFAVVDIVANGYLRRLQQGDEPLHSAAYTAVQRVPSPDGFVTPIAHWPCEDESDSTTVASAVSGVSPAVVSGVTFAADSTVVGAAPLMKLTAAATFNALVPAYTPTGTWTVTFVANVPAEPGVETGLLAWRTTGTASVWRVAVTPGAPSTVRVQAYSSTAQILNDSISLTESEYYAIPQAYTMTVTQDGTGIDYELTVYDTDGGSGTSGTLAANTHGNVTSFTFSPQPGLADVVMGHIALYVAPGASDIFIPGAVLAGNTGELPWARFNRLADEQGIPNTMDISDNLDLEMGPQEVASFMTLARECETVETSAVLNDSGTLGGQTGILWFPAHTDRENIDASLTLDRALGQVAPGFQPILDDQDIVNDVEVTRAGGSSARVEDAAHIAKEGRVKRPVTVNTENDLYLADLAGWRVNLGTVEGYRFPSVTWNLRRSPELAEDWVNMTLFQRLDILHPPSQYPPDAIATILEGYTETISSDTWTVTANLSPYLPNHVMVLAATSGDTDEWLGLLAADLKLALRTAVDADDTAIVVDPNRTRLTVVADDFPLDIRLGGEVVTCSANATTAATFVAAGAASHANNASVTPALPAGSLAGDLLLIWCAIRNSGTGYPNAPTGYTRLVIEGWTATDCTQLFAKVHSGSESNPTVTFTGGVANAPTSAAMMAFRGTPSTLADLADIVVASNSTTNTSTANISYPGMYPPRILPGCVILALGWRQQDWTSVATLSGFTEAIDAPTGTGDNQGIVADYVIQTTSAVINEGTFTVTGGVSGIGRGAVVALAGGYQTLTASARAVNGAVLSHAAGTVVEIEDPGVLGL